MLLDAGASPYVRDSKRKTPLHAVMETCDASKFRQIRRAGADLSMADADDVEALEDFARCATGEVLDVVFEYTDAPRRQEILIAAYFAAIGDNDPAVVARLFSAGVPLGAVTDTRGYVNRFDKIEKANGLIFAMVAPRAGPKIIQYLIDQGISTEVRDARGRTALIFAASEQQIERAQILLAARAEVNAQADDGSTALMRAIDYSREVGRDKNAGPDSAACQGSTEMLKLLLTHGADVRLRDRAGATALRWAQGADCEAFVGPPKRRRLESTGPGPGTIIKLLTREMGRNR
jgi:ankyrin repeat protein